MSVNILIYDNHCNLCSNIKNFIAKYSNNIQFIPLENLTAELVNDFNLNRDFDSIIFIKNKAVYYHSDAVIEICKELSKFHWLAKIISFFPAKFRDKMYLFIAKNRYKLFTKNRACTLNN